MMCRIVAAALSAVLMSTAFAAEEKVYHEFTNRYTKRTTVKYLVKGNVSPGEWTCQWTKAKAYADAHHLPMIIFFGNDGCGHCESSEALLVKSPDFDVWRAEGMGRGIVFVFVVYERDEFNLIPTTESLGAWGFMRNLASFPVVGYYWDKVNPSACIHIDGGTTSPALLMSGAEKWFKGYVPQLNQMGTFDGSDGDFDRLEAEKPGKIAIRLTRENGGEKVSGLLTVTAKGVETPYAVSWDAGETQQRQFVDVTVPEGLKDGDTLELALKDSSGSVEETATVYYVRKGNSAENPLWVGEKLQGELDFGEWTMDLDVAQKKVDQANGAAYVLALLQGSQWCGDCYNVENKFLSLTNAAGENVFQEWAKSNQVALVTIDVPKFTNETEVSSSSLVMREAVEKKLGDVSALRSGLGYLTRKGADVKGGKTAASVLERNHRLITTDTAQGGFHRPEDSSPYRTGVPYFVLVRKFGTVAGRLTYWASTTKGLTEANAANYLKRFDELLQLNGKLTEIENNDASTTTLSLTANGGEGEEASLCNADFVDVFHLSGFGGNARETLTLTGTPDAELTVSFVATNAQGKSETIASRDITLSSGETVFSHDFTQAGDYFVKIEGKSIESDAFKMASTNDSHFISYKVRGETVLVPQEDRATADKPIGSDKVLMAIESNAIYRIEGLASCEHLVRGDLPENFYTANVTTDRCEVVLSGNAISYQIWKPGSIRFAETGDVIVKSVCDITGDPLEIPVQRTGGKSGAPIVRVTVNEDLTTLDAQAFEVQTPELAWGDGVSSNLMVKVYVDDDPKFTYDRTIVLNLELANADSVPGCSVAEDGNQFALLVIEMDTKAPGRAMFSRTEPYCAKPKTVYVKEGESCAVFAARIEDALEQQHVTIKSSLATTQFTTDDWRDFGYKTRDEAEAAKKDLGTLAGSVDFYWSAYELGEKPIYVSGVPAGKTARLTMTAYNKPGTKAKDQFKVVSASNTVSVVGVAADGPEFEVERKSYEIYRYVSFSDAIALKEGTYTSSVPSKNKEYAKTFSKLSGTLPTGLKAVWDKTNDSLSISGVPSIKAGTYTAVYQVSEKRPSGRSTTNVAGLTVEITFTVVDPVDTKAPEGALNPAAAAARTIPDLMVIGKDTNDVDRLMGTLQVTIPPAGRLSARYVCEAGSVSLSAKNWSEFRPAEDNLLRAELVGSGKFKDYGAIVNAASNGAVKVTIVDPNNRSSVYEAYSDGVLWTKGSTSRTKPVPANTAKSWAGYYTVALVPTNWRNCSGRIIEETEGLAPRGVGYLTLKMDLESAWNAGKVTWAGQLPNGTAVSGNSVLTKGIEGLRGKDGHAYLPVFKQSATDVYGLAIDIASAEEIERLNDSKCVNDADFAVPFWRHTERTAAAKAGYLVEFDVCGALYDKAASLSLCCETEIGTMYPDLMIDIGGLGGYTYSGEPKEIDPIQLELTESTMVIPRTASNPYAVRLTLNRSTGVVSGSFKLPYAYVNPTTKAESEKTIASVAYKGIILRAWGEGCTECGKPLPGQIFLPFVVGSYSFTDKIEYLSGYDRFNNPIKKALNVKRGSRIEVDKRVED